MNKLLKKVLSVLLPIVLASQYSFATPLPALFYASSFEVNVGDTLTFDLKVNPPASAPVYTVGATLKYDPSILTYSDASVDKAWLPLSRSPYEVTDTSSGVITRTAGYPQGLGNVANFTHYVFKATAPGETRVVISQGMALDAENNDAGLQVKTIAIKVNGAKAKDQSQPTAASPESSKKLVPQTITLSITGSNALYTDTDYSFGVLHTLDVAQDTVGTTSYSVFNQDGQDIYNGEQVFNTATDTNLTFTIPSNTIQPGDYTIVVNSKYSNQKSPTTFNKPIGVLAKGEKVVEKTMEVPVIPIYVYIGIGFLLFIILLMIIYNKSKAFRKFLKNF